MKINAIILTTLILLLYTVSSGQVQKIKIAKEKINIEGFWNAFSPDSNLTSGTWRFETDSMVTFWDTINGLAWNSKYALEKNTLTFTLRLKCSWTTVKFHVLQNGDKLKLQLHESTPLTGSRIKTIILTRKTDKRIDSDLIIE